MWKCPFFRALNNYRLSEHTQPSQAPAQAQILGRSRSRASSALTPGLFCLASVVTSEPCLGVNKLQGNQPHSPHARLLLGRFHRGKWLLPAPLCTSREVQSCEGQLRALLSQQECLHHSEFSAPQHRHLMNPSGLPPCQAGPPGPVWSFS